MTTKKPKTIEQAIRDHSETLHPEKKAEVISVPHPVALKATVIIPPAPVKSYDAEGRELDANGRRLDSPVTE